MANVNIPSMGNFSTSTLSKVLSSENKKDAITMGIWERIVDFFHGNEKSKALSKLYDFVHSDTLLYTSKSVGEDVVEIEKEPFNIGGLMKFKQLRLLAIGDCQDQFKAVYNKETKDIEYFVGSVLIKKEPMSDFFKNLKFNDQLFLPQLKQVIAEHFQQQSNTKVELKSWGEDNLVRSIPAFYQDHPEVSHLLVSLGFADYEAVGEWQDYIVSNWNNYTDEQAILENRISTANAGMDHMKMKLAAQDPNASEKPLKDIFAQAPKTFQEYIDNYLSK